MQGRAPIICIKEYNYFWQQKVENRSGFVTENWRYYREREEYQKRKISENWVIWQEVDPISIVKGRKKTK